MKIAFAISGKGANPCFSEVFGRSKYFKIIDSDNGRSSILCNPFSESFGGAGIQTSQFLIENECDVLITKTIGAQALSVLEAAQIKVYLCSCDDSIEAEKQFNEGELEIAKLEDLVFRRKRRRRRRGYN